jgi:hypothetical protein
LNRSSEFKCSDALLFSTFGGCGLSPLARIEWSTRRGVDAAGSLDFEHSAEADVYDGEGDTFGIMSIIFSTFCQQYSGTLQLATFSGALRFPYRLV